MKRILALRGRGNSGKTTTITLLADMLKLNGWRQVPGKYKQHGKDFIDMYKKDSILLGVTSSGDTFDLVNNMLQQMDDASCHIGICACRTYDFSSKPGTNAAVNGHSENVLFIEKTYAEGKNKQLEANTKDASKVFNSL